MTQKTPTFPFYYRDFLHAVRHMTELEAYNYLLLLTEQADSPTGSIPENIFDKMCASEMARDKFEQDANGYFNVRMRDVLHKREEFRQLQSRKAKKRWDGNAGAVPLEDENENRKGKGKENTALKKKEPDPPLVFPFTDELFMNRWQVWREYKQEQFGFKYKHKGEQAALYKLGKLAGGNLRVAIAIIEESMANGWKGFWEYKPTKSGQTLQQDHEAFRRADEIMKEAGL